MGKRREKLWQRLLEVSFPAIIDILWVVGFVSLVTISVYITVFVYFSLEVYGVNKYLNVGLTGYVFINVYIIVCGLLFRVFVPKMKEGRAKAGISKQYFNWRLNWHFYSYVFLFLKKYAFYNRTVRYIFLRLFRVNIKYSTYFAETVDLQDANNLLTIGSNSGLGSEVIVATHLALSPTVIIFKEVRIGDNTHIQAKASLAPGVTIGNNSIVGFGTAVSLFVIIGDNTRIGGNSTINAHAKIGDNCRIGIHVYIGEKLIIPDNTVIPDSAVIRNMEELKRYLPSNKDIQIHTYEEVAATIEIA